MRLYKCICGINAYYYIDNIVVFIVAENLYKAENLAIAEMKRRRYSRNAFVKTTTLIATNDKDFKENILVVQDEDN